VKATRANVGIEIEKQPIDLHFGQRRERIATLVLAQLVGAAESSRPSKSPSPWKLPTP
jgi:hypothetical protein